MPGAGEATAVMAGEATGEAGMSLGVGFTDAVGSLSGRAPVVAACPTGGSALELPETLRILFLPPPAAAALGRNLLLNLMLAC